jgi:hypothetical protein
MKLEEKRRRCRTCGLGCSEKSINFVEIMPQLNKEQFKLQVELGLYCDEAKSLIPRNPF